LSREDNCIFYNSILAYHLPTRTKTTPFTPDENNAAAQADFSLLQAYREYINEDKMVEYYVRAEKIVTQIRGIHQNDRSIWKGYYERYVKDILDALRNNDKSTAVVKTVEMLEALEYTNGRVICTWLRNNGLFSAKDLAIDTEFSVQYLSDNTKIGYWLWAVPLVQYMEKNYRNHSNSLFVKTIRIIAASSSALSLKLYPVHNSHASLFGKAVLEEYCFELPLPY
jgi:hypothetical protein